MIQSLQCKNRFGICKAIFIFFDYYEISFSVCEFDKGYLFNYI